MSYLTGKKYGMYWTIVSTHTAPSMRCLKVKVTVLEKSKISALICFHMRSGVVYGCGGWHPECPMCAPGDLGARPPVLRSAPAPARLCVRARSCPAAHTRTHLIESKRRAWSEGATLAGNVACLILWSRSQWEVVLNFNPIIADPLYPWPDKRECCVCSQL